MKKVLLIMMCLMALGCQNGTVAPVVDAPKEKPVPIDYSKGIDPGHNATPDDANKIEYEAHTRTKKAYNGAMWQWWDIVIRPINPAKDNYKGFCRYIIRDIVKNKGAEMNGLTICIYDNERAYIGDNEDAPDVEMEDGDTRAQIMARFKKAQAKWKADLKFADKHRIGMYTGILPDQVGGEEASYILMFYDGDSKGKYQGQEKFIP